MTLSEQIAHRELVDSDETVLHTHPKHADAGLHSVGARNTWEAITFLFPFPTVPIIVAFPYREARTHVRNITVNGFEIRCDRHRDIAWIAREKGYE